MSGHRAVEPSDFPDPAVAGRLVAWAAAAVAGRCQIGQAVAAIEVGSDGHVVTRLPGTPTEDQSIAEAIGWLRRARPRRIGLVLPTFGDPLGLRGDSPLSRAALVAGSAVAFVADALEFGWIPEVDARGSSYRGVRWYHLAGTADIPAPPADPERIIEQADRALRRALRTVTNALSEVDLARWRPEAVTGRHAADTALRAKLAAMPPGWPVAARSLAERALALWRVAAVAAADPGATSASAAAVRADAVRALSRAVREATMAAFNVPAAALLAGTDG
jgi:hypothetical protein